MLDQAAECGGTVEATLSVSSSSSARLPPPIHARRVWTVRRANQDRDRIGGFEMTYGILCSPPVRQSCPSKHLSDPHASPSWPSPPASSSRAVARLQPEPVELARRVVSVLLAAEHAPATCFVSVASYFFFFFFMAVPSFIIIPSARPLVRSIIPRYHFAYVPAGIASPLAYRQSRFTSGIRDESTGFETLEDPTAL
ncbi:hypothetical protein MSAN_01799700 [Mycena sanguinolenta]|uniref:Uncharacterized protein n=1 Tax=Mycena sanguinolenta TaxID=230812 RepID=A0A8H6XSX3_9AGAR|nr:hypothetical protein MSAN_01799700 [Mycena sanguinolenta]